MKTAPCFGCGKRETGCHGGCGEYAAWKAASERCRMLAHRDGMPMAVLAIRARKNERHRQLVSGRGMIHH